MSNLALGVEGLGKMYRIGGKQERYATLRDTLTDAVAAPFKRARSLMRGEAYGAAGLKEEIWALKDVSFEVKQGEVVGIIGRNGAGKSTLLKILSRITEPTEGYAEVYGRVGSLLEVGTGFHPELTGRENIYLNGAILGMSREEINRKFDEIVDFAEIEKFIDTPVKHYSSGMGLRLGFAVAAHLEPEILVVDEVLAVGDAEFQKKCLGKMSDVAGEGRTVLFVSHNMAAVSALCTHGILLNEGQVINIGAVGDIIARYMSLKNTQKNLALQHRTDRYGKGHARFTDFQALDQSGSATDTLMSGNPTTLVVELASSDGSVMHDVKISVVFTDLFENRLFCCATHFNPPRAGSLNILPPTVRLHCHIPQFPLVSGLYRVLLHLAVGGSDADQIDNAVEIAVVEGDFFGTGKLPVARKHGSVLVHHEWEIVGETGI